MVLFAYAPAKTYGPLPGTSTPFTTRVISNVISAVPSLKLVFFTVMPAPLGKQDPILLVNVVSYFNVDTALLKLTSTEITVLSWAQGFLAVIVPPPLKVTVILQDGAGVGVLVGTGVGVLVGTGVGVGAVIVKVTVFVVVCPQSLLAVIVVDIVPAAAVNPGALGLDPLTGKLVAVTVDPN